MRFLHSAVLYLKVVVLVVVERNRGEIVEARRCDSRREN